jgi:hypothetical protein
MQRPTAREPGGRRGAGTALALLLLTLPACRGRAPERAVGHAPSAPSRAADDTGRPRTFDDQVRQVRREAPAGFAVLELRPYVLAGDLSPSELRRYGQDTVLWADTRLRRQLFVDAPERSIAIWLFRDDASYRKHAKAIWDETPSTPYGYSCSTHDHLVMNIATGGGTLVHELVHPLVRAHFPTCPTWLNEGLGSLYEQCQDHEGKIWGLPNWRLPALQQAIRGRTVPRLQAVLETTESAFYGEGSGMHYAVARYLCLYLQDKGLLEDFYRRFRAAAAQDPTGVITLKAVLGEPELARFQATWENFVLGLVFEG